MGLPKPTFPSLLAFAAGGLTEARYLDETRPFLGKRAESITYQTDEQMAGLPSAVFRLVCVCVCACVRARACVCVCVCV